MKPRNEIRRRPRTARQFGDVEHVGQHLFAGRPQDEANVRARVGEQLTDGIGDRPVVPAPVQPLQQAQRIADRHQVRRRIRGQDQLLAGVAAEIPRHPEWMKGAEAVTEFKQLFVVDREQRTLERGKHRELVIRPFDRGERRADGFDFLAAVERFAADQQVRDAARLDCVYVRTRHVLSEADEPAEQQRDVARLKGHAPFGAIRLAA